MTAITSEQLERRGALSEPAEVYRRMVEIRTFEDQISGLFAQGLIHGTTHTCQGQEALDVALAKVLEPTDAVACTYRGHGIALALGMTPEEVLGEIMGRSTGCVGGLGGSMHLSDPTIGLLPTFAIVGAGIPIATGAAVAFQTRGEKRVAVSVFGDGATNIGGFHEGINLAAVWKLPVVFVIDNNLYGEYSRINTTTLLTDLSVRSQSYGIPGRSVDGMNVDTVSEALAECVERARSGGGPSVLEVRTYRFAGHSRSDEATYRPEGELDSWLKRDPVKIRREALLTSGSLSEVELGAIESEVDTRIAEVVESSKAAPEPGVASMFQNVWAPADEDSR
jgi:pyruvate dehydrogenase E1 component alpha subunit